MEIEISPTFATVFLAGRFLAGDFLVGRFLVALFLLTTFLAGPRLAITFLAGDLPFLETGDLTRRDMTDSLGELKTPKKYESVKS